MVSSLELEIVCEREAAKLIGVTYSTIHRWRRQGWVSVGRIGNGPGPTFDLGPPPLAKCGGAWVGLRDEINAWAEAWRKASIEHGAQNPT